MKLTRLRLIGFKSFVEPTDFVIEPGLTGVVGPNGCGKSNLVEAVRWVMGEASYKAMRASEMDDVIFSGNTERPARNHAEVSVAIDNSDRTAPAAFNDSETLEVSRRIMREQGSTFRVNGREVRARDVTVLFADASTGSRSPALVHQGRIGEIIQARPDQRRRVLEEAAGISGLHARRHEAELRLKAAEQNLDAGRGRHRPARRAGRIAEDPGAAGGTLPQHFRTGAQDRGAAASPSLDRRRGRSRHDAEHTRDEAVRVVAARTGEQTVATTRQTEVAAGLPTLREAEAQSGRGLAAIDRRARDARAGRGARQGAHRGTRSPARAVRRRPRTRAQSRRRRASGAARLATEETALTAEALASAERLIGVNTRVAAADAALSVSEKTFADLTGALADLSARRNQLQAAQQEHEQRAARLQSELTNIEAGLVATGSGQPDLAALDTLLASAQAALAEAETAAHAAEAAHTQARSQRDAVREPLAVAERGAHRLETEAKTIGRLLDVDSKNLWPPVMDSLIVTNGYEKALGAALGDDLDASVGDGAPLRWGGSIADPFDPKMPEGVATLAQYVEAPPQLARRLAQIGVVDRNQGPQLAALLKPGQRLVSREGDFWRWDGFAVAAQAPSGAAQRLAQRGRLDAIAAEIEIARSDVEAKRHAADAAETALAAAAAAETQARERWRETQRLTDAAREEHAAAEREISRNAARISALKEARQRISAGRDEAAAAHHEAVTGTSRVARGRRPRSQARRHQRGHRQGSWLAC